MGEVLYRSWYGQNIVGERPVKYCLPDRWNTARFPFLIPFWALSSGFLRVARYPPAASQIATAKTSVNNAGRHRRTIDKSLGTKEALAVRLRKLAIDGEKTLRGTCVPAELPGVVLSAFEHRLDRTARTYLSFIGAPASERIPKGYRVTRAIALVYQARYIGEVRHRDARSPEAVPKSRSTTRRPAPARELV